MSPLSELAGRLDPSCVLVAPEEMAPFLGDWRGRRHGRALAVLRPRAVADVSTILRWATVTRTPIVPQGGNTGLSAGATPDESGRCAVLSLGRLNRIRAVDAEGDSLTAEAGCVLAQLQQEAAKADRLFPLSLGSEGSCQVGGIVATNAGGINVIRYGTVRDLVLGLEYVRADGAVIHGLKPLRKDNAGYALRDLLIGSEGTLAVITAASFRLFAQPKASATGLCGIPDPTAAIRLLTMLREVAGERISSFELMCDAEMGLTLDLLGAAALPFHDRHPWYVFIEIADSAPDAAMEQVLTRALALAFDAAVLSDAVVAQSGAQAKALWHLRFAVSEANKCAGPSVSHDTSVATADVPRFIAAVQGAAAERFPTAQPLFVGHVGDGNIHVILLFGTGEFQDEAAFAALAASVNVSIFEIVSQFGGSITAEHGVGRSLVGALRRAAQPETLELMAGIKNAFDPLGILNPGAVLAAPPP
ncbi:FAD/FMN-containing dehydrogenase [Bosea sp. OK403]|uniref:FAD-binding oxidoreductase n=1 Tax=Bosea sp. OK403 TaxID=1855286 RepID=UPI0008E82FE7|nr:FAD-binding oxidoreductase [Bosea sp. OK403]SFI83735.1 FAD/FMN-containing dehydrogenase [Bosea sp. OK403]